MREHAQEMSEDVMYRHIDLYVNDYSVDLGAEGRRAVRAAVRPRAGAGDHSAVTAPLFLRGSQVRVRAT